MANSWEGQNEFMSNTVLAKNESVSSFLREQVLPILYSWENDITTLVGSKTKTSKDQLFNVVSQMIAQTKQLQFTLGVGDHVADYKELTDTTSVPEQMLVMITEWKMDCNNIEKNLFVKHNEETDQTHDVTTLFSKIHGQLLYWVKSVTPEETGQEKEPPVVQHGRHARQDERQLQHRRLSISPIIERRPSPQYRPQNAALIAEIKQQRRRPIIPLTTDRRLPMNPMFPNEPRTTDGYQPQHPPPPNISPTAVGRQQQRNHPFETFTIDERQKLINESSNLRIKYDSAVAQSLEYKKRESEFAAEIDKMKEEMERIREELNKQVMVNHQVAREKDEALNRLSEIAGQKLRQNNPAITDLSTKNRPTKIAEGFKELYTNQWTDAFTELTENGWSDKEAIDILLRSLDDSFVLTANISEKQMKQLENSAQMLAYIETTDEPEVVRQTRYVDKAKTLPIRKKGPTSNRSTDKMQTEHMGGKKPVPLSLECEDLLGQAFKASAPGLVSEVQQRFLKEKQVTVKFPEKNLQIAMTEFYKECAGITWLMNVQTPPMSLAPKPATGTQVQTDLYSFYTQSGEKVDYVVWPACLLHENGPLLTKGIVQPFKTGRRKRAKEEKENGRRETPE